MDFTVNFILLFLHVIYLLLPIMLFFISIIFILGQVVGRIEGWTKFNSFYWAFITALTVGYGDIHPIKKVSRIISLLIALIGIMFTGVIVAITITTATKAFSEHGDPEAVQELKRSEYEQYKSTH